MSAVSEKQSGNDPALLPTSTAINHTQSLKNGLCRTVSGQFFLATRSLIVNRQNQKQRRIAPVMLVTTGDEPLWRALRVRQQRWALYRCAFIFIGLSAKHRKTKGS